MTSLVETIEAAITKNFARESVVTLSDGREITTQADPEAIRELAVEIKLAVIDFYGFEDDEDEEPWKVVGPRRVIPPEVLGDEKAFSKWLHDQDGG